MGAGAEGYGQGSLSIPNHFQAGGLSANAGLLAGDYGQISAADNGQWGGKKITNPVANAGFGGAGSSGGLLGADGYGTLGSIMTPPGAQGGGKIDWGKLGLGAAKGLGWGGLLGGGYMRASSAYQAGQAQGAYHDLVADSLDFNAGQSVVAARQENEYIAKKAAWELGAMRDNLKRLLGRQAATAASAGVGTDSVTFEHIAKDTIKSSLEDEAMLRYNAEVTKFENTKRANLERINMETQAGQQRYAGKAARIKGKYDMYGSIFSTAGQAVGMLG